MENHEDRFIAAAATAQEGGAEFGTVAKTIAFLVDVGIASVFRVKSVLFRQTFLNRESTLMNANIFHSR